MVRLARASRSLLAANPNVTPVAQLDNAAICNLRPIKTFEGVAPEIIKKALPRTVKTARAQRQFYLFNWHLLTFTTDLD